MLETFHEEPTKYKHLQGSMAWCTGFGTGNGNFRVSSASNISTLCRWNKELGSSRTGVSFFAASAFPFLKSQ